jgi:hypothetical protein
METIHYSNGAGYSSNENSNKCQKYTLLDFLIDSLKVSRTEEQIARPYAKPDQ